MFISLLFQCMGIAILTWLRYPYIQQMMHETSASRTLQQRHSSVDPSPLPIKHFAGHVQANSVLIWKVELERGAAH
jgi:hypothetical protein